MKLDSYIEADFPILARDENEKVKFSCRFVCDCGELVFKNDNFCRRCGAAVTPREPVVVWMTWREVKELIRPRIEAELLNPSKGYTP